MLAVKIALDRVPAYQEEIKALGASRDRLAHRLRARVAPTLRWYGPELYFDQLELRSKDGRRVLAHASGGRIGADVWQLIRSGKLFAVRVELVSPDLVIARLGPKSFALGSELEINSQGGAAQTLSLDDLPAGTVTVRSGRMTVQNWNSALPQLLLDRVNFTIRRDASTATLKFSASMPPALGGEVSVTGRAAGLAASEGPEWNVDAQARDVAFAGWRLLLPEYLSNLNSGGGGFQLAVRGRSATFTGADLKFAAQSVVTRLSAGVAASFDQISGNVALRHSGDRWTLSGRQVRASRAGRKDPLADFDAEWRAPDAGLLELRASASFLRADSLLPLAGLLPQRDIREQLLEVAPTGVWTDARFALSRSGVGAPWSMQVQARFSDVGFAPIGRAPGFRGLSGSIVGDQSGGHLALDSTTVLVAWPGQWQQPVQLDTLKGSLYWHRTDAGLLIASPALDLRNPTSRMHAQAALQLAPDGSSPDLTLVADLANGNVASRALLSAARRDCAEGARVARPCLRRRAPDAGATPFYADRCGSFRFATAAACFWSTSGSRG